MINALHWSFFFKYLESVSVKMLFIVQSTMHESAHIPPVSQTNPKPNPRLKCKSELFQLALTDLKIYQCLYFVSKCTPVMFFLGHVYKNDLNVLKKPWPNPGLV